VGSAQSGTQIAEDLLAAGRRVILSTSPVGRVPARHRGRATLEQLVECGFFAQRPRDLPDQSVLSAPQPLIAPGGRSISLQALARAGVTLTGRLVAVEGEHVTFDRSTLANMATGDVFATRIRAMLDEIIQRSGGPAPPIEPDRADLPIQLDPPLTLNLRADGVGAIVWCTG
jgi:putative flavoprotein involved in K+ transport